jgi:hypothetical protein
VTPDDVPRARIALGLAVASLFWGGFILAVFMHECLVDALVAAKIAFAPVHARQDQEQQGGSATYADARGRDRGRRARAQQATASCQVQRMAVRDGHQLLVTELRWKGECLASEMILPLEGLDPQGSARYSPTSAGTPCSPARVAAERTTTRRTRATCASPPPPGGRPSPTRTT